MSAASVRGSGSAAARTTPRIGRVVEATDGVSQEDLVAEVRSRQRPGFDTHGGDAERDLHDWRGHVAAVNGTGAYAEGRAEGDAEVEGRAGAGGKDAVGAVLRAIASANAADADGGVVAGPPAPQTDPPLWWRVEWATVGETWRGEGAGAELARVVERTRLRCNGLAAHVVPFGCPVEPGPCPLTLTLRITGDGRGDHGVASVQAWFGPDHAAAFIMSSEWRVCETGDATTCLTLARGEAMRWLDGFAGTGWRPLPEAAAAAPFTGGAGDAW